MIRTQILLGEEEYRDAKAEARRQGIPLAEFLRRAVGVALGGRKALARPWMRYAGAVSSGDRDASRSVNEVVYGRARPREPGRSSSTAERSSPSLVFLGELRINEVWGTDRGLALEGARVILVGG